MAVSKTRSTKGVRMEVRHSDTSKKRGSNHFTLTVPSDDWRISDQTVSMTIRDAQTVQRFLNSNLSTTED